MTQAYFVRTFQPRFAPMVASGEKLHTVRPTPKRMPKPGDWISLRTWIGKPYRSKQRVLRETTITAVLPISITNCGIMVDGGLRIHPLDDEFAVADGFSSFHEMADWFDIQHGLPFSGIVIYWQPQCKECDGFCSVWDGKGTGCGEKCEACDGTGTQIQ